MGFMKMGAKLLSNLARRPETRNYPAIPREYPPASRGHLEYDPSDCILCNICGRRCPAGAIQADKKARTVTIQRMQCVQCGYCAESCPKSCLSLVPGYTPPDSTKVIDVYTVPEKEKPTNGTEEKAPPA